MRDQIPSNLAGTGAHFGRFGHLIRVADAGECADDTGLRLCIQPLAIPGPAYPRRCLDVYIEPTAAGRHPGTAHDAVRVQHRLSRRFAAASDGAKAHNPVPGGGIMTTEQPLLERDIVVEVVN